jgi:hypothetical protein
LREVKLILEQCPPGEHVFIIEKDQKPRICFRCRITEPQERRLKAVPPPEPVSKLAEAG